MTIDLEEATAVMMADLIKARDRREVGDPVRVEFEKHIDTTEKLIAAARERDGLREDLVVLTAAVDEFATDFIMAHDASPDDSCLRLTAFREAVARLCGANVKARQALQAGEKG